MSTESLCVNFEKFSKYICCNFRDIQFFLGVTIWCKMFDFRCLRNYIFCWQEKSADVSGHEVHRL